MIYNFRQMSGAWFAIRSKKLTASWAQAIGNNGKGLETHLRKNLDIYYGLRERDDYANKNMQDGIDNEDTIRFLYEVQIGLYANNVGFVLHSPYVGFSPDWFIPNIKGAEFKSQNEERHEKALGGKFDSKYHWQVQFSMYGSGLNEWDLVSYNKYHEKDLSILTVKRDEKKIDKLKEGIETGIKIIKEYENKYEGKV